jgi:hypothetical protein
VLGAGVSADGVAHIREVAAAFADRLAERRAVMDKLPMVEWDRCVRPGDGTFIVYGWIARSDGQRDFVVLSFLWPTDPTAALFTTSSAKHSAEIARLLYGSEAEHIDCERVSDVFQ